MIKAKSGTGKTLVFCTVILERFDMKANGPQSLIIVPTREVALQIESYLNALSLSIKGFRAVSVIGGRDVNEDRKKVNRCSAIVGTPGRLLHLLNNNVIQTSQIKILVLDEADKLLSMGFRNDINSVLRLLNRNQQIIASSATYANDLDKLLLTYMKNPIAISATRDAPILLGIKQFLYEIDETNSNSSESAAKIMMKKIECIENILTNVTFKQCIAFSNSQLRAESYYNYLLQRGWTVDVILGSQEQNVRTSTFTKFKSFQSRILIASDLMARGVDIENVNLVINLDIPTDSSTYLHRIGRCGRFGSHGIAVTFTANAVDLMKFRKLLAEIGGADMKVLKFPNKGKIYNNAIWNFENRKCDEEIFGEVCGFAESDSGIETKVSLVPQKKTHINVEISSHVETLDGEKCDNLSNIVEKNSEFLEILKSGNDHSYNITDDIIPSEIRFDKKEAGINDADENIFGIYKKERNNVADKKEIHQEIDTGVQNIVEKNLELLDLCKVMVADRNNQAFHIHGDIFADYKDKVDDLKETNTNDFRVDENIFAAYLQEKNKVADKKENNCEVDNQAQDVMKTENTASDLNQTNETEENMLEMDCTRSGNFEDTNFMNAFNNITIGAVPLNEDPSGISSAFNTASQPRKSFIPENKDSSERNNNQIKRSIKSNGCALNLWQNIYKAQLNHINYYVNLAQQNSMSKTSSRK